MAHTIEDLVMNIADKHSAADSIVEANETYKKNKEMLWELVEELHHPMYIKKLSKPNYKEL